MSITKSKFFSWHFFYRYFCSLGKTNQIFTFRYVLLKLHDDTIWDIASLCNNLSPNCAIFPSHIWSILWKTMNNEPYTPKNPGELENFDPTKYLKVEKIRKTRKVGYVEIQLRTPVNLEEVYAKEPYSPPPPVGKGSLIVASWEGLLSRAKVLQFAYIQIL